MAGKPGRSGGARPGAGRKPAPPVIKEVPEKDDPLAFLLGVMKDDAVDLKERVRCAIAAAQYVHTKRHDGGKKDEVAEKAEKAGSKFKPAAPPRLVVNR